MTVPLPLTYYVPKTDCTVSEPREQRDELGERDQAGQLPLPRTTSAHFTDPWGAPDHRSQI